jgi:methionine synthase I (cobalamin-dependent)
MVESSSDKEQIKAVLQYLQKKETRKEALDIVLAYTATPENRALFEGLDVCKVLLRLLPEDDMNVA